MYFVKADITKEQDGLIVHGVNCQQKMASGIAVPIKTTWPAVYDAYMLNGKGKKMLGQFEVVKITEFLYVGNAYTQEYYGYDGKKYADVISVEASLRKAFEFCDEHVITLKMPKIGCTRGGLSWKDEVMPIVMKLEEEFEEVDVEIFEFNPEQPSNE